MCCGIGAVIALLNGAVIAVLNDTVIGAVNALSRAIAIVIHGKNRYNHSRLYLCLPWYELGLQRSWALFVATAKWWLLKVVLL